MSGGPQDCPPRIQWPRKSFIIRGRCTIHREGRERERERRRGKRMRLRVRAPGQWRTPIYHSTDFSENRCSMSFPRRCREEKPKFYTSVLRRSFAFFELMNHFRSDESDFYGNLLPSFKKFSMKILLF